MLKRVGPELNTGICEPEAEASEDAVVKIRGAHFPKIFPWRLEYNCPVHENWNIVHTGMLVPETHQIYVCPVNCLRGVIMTADEMDAAGRISSVMPTERETVDGRLEKVTIEGVTDIINRLDRRPRAVELFLVCMHHLMGADERYIYRTLEERFPDIDFMRCWMDPIMQKISLTPEQKQRKSMMGVIPKLPEDVHSVSILGDDLRLHASSDISRVLAACGITVKQVQDCDTYDDYLDMGGSFLYLTRSALSVYGLNALAEKNERRRIYLPPAAMDSQIGAGLRALLSETEGQQFDLPGFLSKEKEETREAFQRAREIIKDTEIWMDYLAFPRPLSFARRLLDEGFRVTRVCMDAAAPEEKEDFLWLQKHAPDLEIQSTSHVRVRVRKNIAPHEEVLALGPKAAFFAGTTRFVNWIENDGGWGYDGLRKLASDMVDAYRRPKDTRDLVRRKGLGLPSIVQTGKEGII